MTAVIILILLLQVAVIFSQHRVVADMKELFLKINLKYFYQDDLEDKEPTSWAPYEGIWERIREEKDRPR